MTHFQEQFLRYLNAGIPIIYVDSFEAEKVKELIQEIICKRRLAEINLYDMDFGNNLSLEKQLAGMLESYVENFEDTSIILIRDMGFLLESPCLISLLKLLAEKSGLEHGGFNIVLVEEGWQIPQALREFSCQIWLDKLDHNDIIKIINSFCAEHDCNLLLPSLMNALAEALSGYTEYEIRRVLRCVYADGGEITLADLQLIKTKKVMKV